ncbi:MAG: patatin-like phospholipase family protein [Acidimicrobiales bacterium]
MTLGVVLGGGGPVGIAWELGVLHGLAEAGIDLSDPAVVVGTSAGSVVGSHLAAGADLGALVEAQHEHVAMPGSADDDAPAPDLDRVMEIFAILGGDDPVTPELARRVGQMALEADTTSESRWIDNFEKLLAGTSWTDTPLLVTAVDCGSGQRQVWTGGSGVPLALAVASSCAVPGMFPPVTIEGRRYTDGGVWSIGNADLILGHAVDTAVLILPVGAGAEGTMPSVTRERHELATAGIEVITIASGPEFAERIGPNLMDATLRGVASDIGVADGRAAATAFPD